MFGFAGCGRHEQRTASQTELAPVAVHAKAVVATNQITTEEVVGTMRAKSRATLEAKLSGRIAQMPAQLGQTVKSGDLLARIEAAEIKARLDQAEATLEQAERDWKRISALFESQAITRSEYDAAEARKRVAAGAVAEAQAMKEYMQIVAPFDGVITKKWADVGDQAIPGKPLLEIEDPSALQLEADVPETIASKLQRNTQYAIRLDSGSTDLSGTLTEISPVADPVSRTFRVKLDAPSASMPGTSRLMSGQFARLLVPVGEQPSLRVPFAAVVRRGQLEITFVVENQHAQMHLVKTGKRVGDEIEILSGLDIGDAVVSDGAGQLLDGQPVTSN